MAKFPLDFLRQSGYYCGNKSPLAHQGPRRNVSMEDFGSDFITITDEDGVEYELEVLTELEYQG